MSYSPWGCTELDTTERLTLSLSFFSALGPPFPPSHAIPTCLVITWSDRMQTLPLLSRATSYLLTLQASTDGLGYSDQQFTQEECDFLSP